MIGVLVLIGVVVLAKSTTSKSSAGAAGGTHPTTTTTVKSSGTAPSTTTTTLVPASAVKILVLNGAAPTQPLGSEWSNKLRVTYGYDTLPADNSTSTVTASTIYVLTPGYAGEASRLAAEVGLTSSAIVTNVTSTAPIPTRDKASANLILVIGPDLVSSA